MWITQHRQGRISESDQRNMETCFKKKKDLKERRKKD
jgi:hypothetical protein